MTRLDAVGNTEVVEEVLKAIFEASPNLPFKFDGQLLFSLSLSLSLSFPLFKLTFITENFWDNLTPDSVVLMRVFCEYTVQKKEDTGVDELLPEISKFCFYLRKYYDLMGEAIEDEERDSYEFVVEQLLLLSNVFDFSDEVGRRAMFSMLREDFTFLSNCLATPPNLFVLWL